ncbi:MAG: alpha/beta fold hydrolase [Lentihominibacter sp.]
MKEKVFQTDYGPIHYWIDAPVHSELTLVFLPGLTADHRLFDKQIEYFRGRYNVFTWDAPGHAASCPFRLDFSLLDKARWRDMMIVYDGDKKRYAQLAGHGFRILADAMETDLPYEIKCPSMLICGKQDHAGSCIRYNKAWHMYITADSSLLLLVL